MPETDKPTVAYSAEDRPPGPLVRGRRADGPAGDRGTGRAASLDAHRRGRRRPDGGHADAVRPARPAGGTAAAAPDSDDAWPTGGGRRPTWTRGPGVLCDRPRGRRRVASPALSRRAGTAGTGPHPRRPPARPRRRPTSATCGCPPAARWRPGRGRARSRTPAAGIDSRGTTRHPSPVGRRVGARTPSGPPVISSPPAAASPSGSELPLDELPHGVPAARRPHPLDVPDDVRGRAVERLLAGVAPEDAGRAAGHGRDRRRADYHGDASRGGGPAGVTRIARPRYATLSRAATAASPSPTG